MPCAATSWASYGLNYCQPRCLGYPYTGGREIISINRQPIAMQIISTKAPSEKSRGSSFSHLWRHRTSSSSSQGKQTPPLREPHFRFFRPFTCHFIFALRRVLAVEKLTFFCILLLYLSLAIAYFNLISVRTPHSTWQCPILNQVTSGCAQEHLMAMG